MLLRAWEFQYWECFEYTHFVLQKKDSQIKRFGVWETCEWLCGTVDASSTVSMQIFFLEQQNVNTFQKGPEKASFSAVQWRKRWKIWLIMAGPKFKISQKQMTNERWIFSIYPFWSRNTIHCAERKATLSGNWKLQRLNFFKHFVKRIVSIYD